MSKAENITVSMDCEKIKALRRYINKKGVSIENELTDALNKLYEKYVPVQVREYIEFSDDSEKNVKGSTSKNKKFKKAEEPTAENIPDTNGNIGGIEG